MKPFKQFFLTEGGAAGHMAHPFDLPTVKNGKDLINFFNKAFTVVKRNRGSLKIDGINVSVKLVGVNTAKPQFALDRGSMKPLDVEGITIDKLEARFGAGHGMIAAGQKTLNILNEALPTIKDELDELGLTKDPNLFFNMEFVQGRTNVLSYDHDFLAIHGISRFVQATPNRRESVEVEYNKNVLVSLINKLNKVAKNHNFKIYGDVLVTVKGTPNYNRVLQQPFTFIKAGKKYTEPLGVTLKKAVNPFNAKIKLAGGKTVGALSKEVYVNVLNGLPIENFVKDVKDYTMAVDGAVIYHCTRLLGVELLKTLGSEMGEADKHEGVVLRDNSLAPVPVKITGDFIVKGLESGFKRTSTTTPTIGTDEDDENLNSPYDREKMVYFDPGFGDEGRTLTPKISTFNEVASMAIGHVGTVVNKLVVIYPGRFQPFHLGHAAVYNKIKQEFPTADVYIATSGKTNDVDSPFTFKEKLQMIVSSGIDPSIVQETKNPYVANEIVGRYNKEHTKVIFAVGKKDMEGPDARFKFGNKKDGSPSYFRPFKSVDECKPLGMHGYVMVAPTENFKVNGKSVQSASQIREMYRKANDAQRKQIITELYGKFRPEIYNLFNKKLA